MPRAHTLQLDNVGFSGDFEAGFGACSYINYQSREWNTPGINACAQPPLAIINKPILNESDC